MLGNINIIFEREETQYKEIKKERSNSYLFYIKYTLSIILIYSLIFYILWIIFFSAIKQRNIFPDT
mgnify:CR=1 FL=1